MCKSLTVVVALFLSLCSVAGAALVECAQWPPPPPLDQLQQSDVVFVGVAIGTRLLQNSDEYRTRFRITRAWKGATHRNVVVKSSDDSEGYVFEPGVEYVVYGRYAGDDVWTDGCTRTGPVLERTVDLAELGKLPEMVVAPINMAARDALLGASAVLLLILAGVARLTKRRRARAST